MAKKDEPDAYVIRHKASGAVETVGPLRLDELEKGTFEILEEQHASSATSAQQAATAAENEPE